MPSPSSTLSELTFHRFGVAFGQRVVLAEMELHLAPRGIDVLMGPVKTGKSTLLRTLAGLYQGHALHRTWGLVSLDGAALDDDNRPALVQQQVRLLDQTVLQVLRQAIPSADAVRSPAAWREWAAQLLTEHGQAAWAARLDAPLMDCPLHMQRTLLILSQVAARPRLLMIDEPTAGLSEPDAHTMIQWLRTLGQQCKLLVSLHNQRQARALADAIVLMGGGRVLAYQPVEEFFSRPANELVQQFVQTGSLSLPSPDARPDDLEAGTPLPPPLPPQAVRATATTATAAVAVAAAAPVAANAPAPVPAQPAEVVAAPSPVAPAVVPPAPAVVPAPVAPPQSVAPVVASAAPVSAVKPVASEAVVSAPATVRPVALPLPMLQGVELASSVGRVIVSESRGPHGFRWVVPGMLAGTPQPGVVAPIDHDLILLDRVGITHLITLTETDMDQDALRRHHLKNTHLPIFDRKAPSTSQMHMLLVRMQRLMDAGEVLAVHCKAGLGRTGLVLAAWMVRDGGLSAEAAIERLRKVNPGFIQSDEQLDFLPAYEADILRRLT